ncbi:DSD1 family PLP-dependent enzyme, partial [Klebsiella pneumoniae]|nr:DSD1 family PLP-dependent enzyme [Klebsiella pneumoniae]
MNRRKFMFAGLGAGALLAGTAAWMRPADRGGPYDDYFSARNRELKANGPMCP